MALVPPPNAAGIPLPPAPANPATLFDITNAKEYIERLSASKVSIVPNAPTDDIIGHAEAYKTAIIFSHSPGANAAPPWLANLTNAVGQIANAVGQIANAAGQIANDSIEQPVLLANCQAGTRGPLYNPTLMVAGGWAPLMQNPNPQTRDQLFSFTVNECIASAAALGLPLLPANTPLFERRRQIAIRIGVMIDG